jgi:biotin-dependent carboxylase-like uncharacterized protein
MTFEVLDGGLATTVQDAGRLDWTHLGVPRSGAADPQSLAIANLLIGNERATAALEMTLVGPTLVARGSSIIGLAGADLGAHVVGGRRLVVGRGHRINEGETIAFPGESADRGARAYLTIPGGIDVPEVLGSRSTCLAAAFGGHDGRLLRPGDLIASCLDTQDGDAATLAEACVWPTDPVDLPRTGLLHVLPGPVRGIEALIDGPWRIGREADRVGLRLDGHFLGEGIAGETVSHGVVWGAVQVPPDGRPIILGPDHQTTGGYPVIAVVISADRHVLGQLRPGADVAFEIVRAAEAVSALLAEEAALAAGVVAMRDAARWDELARSAGA